MFNKKSLMKSAGTVVAVVITVTAAQAAFNAYQSQKAGDRIEEKLTTLLPGLQITSIDCTIEPGVCEVVANDQVLYVDQSGRYAFAGSLLDLKTQTDLTRQRREDLQAFTSLLTDPAGASPQVRPERQAPSAAPVRPSQPTPSQVVNVDLPIENAVVRNGGQGLPVIHVFSDLNCGFCQRLHSELAQLEGYEVREYFIQFLGATSGQKAEIVLCAEDRLDAADQFYTPGSTGASVTTAADCTPEQARQLVMENTRFAESFGLQGTPAMILEMACGPGRLHACRGDPCVCGGEPVMRSILIIAAGSLFMTGCTMLPSSLSSDWQCPALGQSTCTDIASNDELMLEAGASGIVPASAATSFPERPGQAGLLWSPSRAGDPCRRG